MVLGVALAVAAVRFAQLMNGGGGDPVVADLRPAFAAMALVAAASAVRFLGLDPDAGDEVAGRGHSVSGGQA